MYKCHVCNTPLVDNKCPENFCFGTDTCLICGVGYEVTEEYMVYGYCPAHEFDMKAVVLTS